MQQPDALGLYSKILQARQQQQALQTGAIEQQTMSQQQQNNLIDLQERRAAAQINPADYQNKDGSYDAAGFSKAISAVAPTTYGKYTDAFNAMAQGGAASRAAYRELNDDQQDKVQRALMSWAQNPEAKPSDLNRNLQMLEDNATDADKASIQKITNNARNLVSAMPDTQTAKNAAKWWAGSHLTVEGQLPQPGSVDTGPNVQLTNRNPILGTTTGGGVINKGLSPTQTPGYVGQMSGLESDINTLKTAQVGATNAPAIKAMADAYQQVTAPGSGAQRVAANPQMADLARRFGLDPQSTTNAQLAEKLRANLTTTLQAGGRDAGEREELAKRVPAADANPDTVREAMDGIRAQAQYSVDRFQNLQNKHIITGRPQGATESDLNFTQSRPGPQMAPKQGQYNDANAVKAAYQSGKLTRDQAKQALKQFGYQ